MAEVVLDDLRKRYGEVEAVQGLDLAIQDQEFLVLVGPSGCGKTTALRMIAGLEEVSDGEIRIDGVRVNELTPSERDIAMVFQNYALYPHMSVYDNLAFCLEMRRYTKAQMRERIHEVADMLGLRTLLDRKPGQLSGGQRQRVAVGRAIVRRPKLFLFDEPLSNLDAKLRGHMRSELKRLHYRLGATSIYVTHDQVEAMTLGDRVVVMRDGLIQQTGAPLEIYTKPANLFVAGFLGSPSMNLIECRLEQAGGHLALAADGMRLALGDGARQGLGRFDGPRVTAGIRPEALRLAAPDSPPGQCVEGRVELVEPLGAEILAEIRVGGTTVVTRVPAGTDLCVGQPLRLSCEPDAIHLFDPDTERRLGPS